MRIRIDDIPAAGKVLDFTIEAESLNQRVAPVRGSSKSQSKKASKQSKHSKVPVFSFPEGASVSMTLKAKGMTVELRGQIETSCDADCARCAETVSQQIVVPVEMYLKPRKVDSAVGAEDEDIGYGFHDGETIDCTDVCEELIMLALPMIVRCEEGSDCASSVDEKSWIFGEDISEEDSEGVQGLAALKNLKIH